MRLLFFTVTGAPRTKKNHGIIVTRGRPRMLPSKPWRKWAENALIRFNDPDNSRVVVEPVNCRALFYCDTARSVDPVGLYQGLADLLEKRGVLENDRLIASWDGSRVLIDRENPRTEVMLERLED